MKRMFPARAASVARALCPTNVTVHQCGRFLPLLALLFLILLIPTTPLHAQTCWAAWNSSTAYNGGSQVSYNGENYQSAFWTQNQVPSSNSGPAGSGQPWIPEGSCSGGGGGGCTPTAITPYTQVGSGSWQQTASVTVSSGSSVKFGPQPVTGGSWSWTGPNGFSSTSREITVTASANATYTATYTNPSGCKSMQTFTITISGGGGCTPTSITPYVQVNNGSWQQTSSVSVSSGSTVKFGPQPVTGGSWSWSGPNGFSSTSREISFTANSSSTYTATYTNPSGCKSTQTFSVTVTSGGCGSNCGGGGPFIFSPYKDITVDANWNTGEQQTTAGGSSEPVTQAMPNQTLTWAFATGDCTAETWAGITPSLEASNVQQYVNSGKKYILSTGGAAGTFTCSSASGLAGFINRYNSSNLVGVDFDIENGPGPVQGLVNSVKGVMSQFPNLRFSFTVASFGQSGMGQNVLNSTGQAVMNAIQSAGLSGNWTINPMAFDFGTTCMMVNGVCDMGQSAIGAMESVSQGWGISNSHIEVTLEVPTDDGGQPFTMGDVNTVCSWARSNGAAGVHYWALDRDTGLTYAKAFPSACGTN